MSEEHPGVGAESAAPDSPPTTPPPAEPVAGGEAAVGAETPAAPPAETPPDAPEPVPAEAPAEPALKPHTDEPGLLSLAEEAKEGEPVKESEEKPAELPEEIKYEWKFPEGTEIQGERLEAFERYAREQKFTPEVAQSLVTMHAEAMQAYDALTLQRQHDAFAETRRAWSAETKADPVLGGAGFETNRGNAIKGLNALVNEAQKYAEAQGHPLANYHESVNNALLATGMADHPVFMWLAFAANRLAERLREPAQPATSPTPRAPIENASGQPPGEKGLRYAYPRGGRRAS